MAFHNRKQLFKCDGPPFPATDDRLQAVNGEVASRIDHAEATARILQFTAHRMVADSFEQFRNAGGSFGYLAHGFGQSSMSAMN